MYCVHGRTVLIATIVAAVLSSMASAAVVYKDVPELTAEAKQIVVGDVVSLDSFWDANHELIKSRVVVSVDQYLVGEGNGIEELVIDGGTVGDVELHVSVLPEFEVGDRVLLFLGGSEIRLVQSFQGAYLTDGVQIARMSPVCSRIIEESIQPLTDFVGQIQRALPPGSRVPKLEPYDGDFVLPVGGARYGLCGYDWTYKADPMGENYKINANCADASAGDADSQRTQIQNGFGAWNGAGADFEFVYGGTSTQTSVVNNGTNLIYFAISPPSGGGYVAANFHWVTGGNMTESDIVFNDLDYVWWNGSGLCSGKMDIWNVITHELGHTLCLDDLYGGGDTAKTMYGYVSNCETYKRTLHADDIAGIRAIYGAIDTTPPTPNPMTFDVPPYATTSGVSMEATTANDAETPPVQYQFLCDSGGTGCDTSVWKSGEIYDDAGLLPNTQYCYSVKARDSAPTPNETTPSSSACAYTYAAIPGAPTLGGETTSSMDITVNPNGNPSYTEFVIYCLSSPDA
ncbi:MAG TPA: matrixin family metalloprotease, partial [Phycisphaerae bacterium]|nr:matrixin family metalloprotease [Phycisphaerae bacterium]